MYDGFEKYAIYWVPKHADPLAQFGAAWTGWCAEQGERHFRGALGDLSFDTATITKLSRRHGFHGVIKAPFRLGAGRSHFSLEHIFGRLAEDSVSFQLPRLRLAVVGGCVVLVPSQRSPAINDLVDRAGKALAALEAAASADSFAEPQAVAPADALEPTEMAAVDPAIELPTAVDHHFQMPLTDPICPDLALEVMGKLQLVLMPTLRQPRQLSDLALMGDPGEGRPLRVLLRHNLRDWPLREESCALACLGPHLLMNGFNDPKARSGIAI